MKTTYHQPGELITLLRTYRRSIAIFFLIIFGSLIADSCSYYRKKVRQEMYYIMQHGINSHLEKTNNLKKHYLYHLLGKINHIIFINPKDTEFINYRQHLHTLRKQSKIL